MSNPEKRPHSISCEWLLHSCMMDWLSASSLVCFFLAWLCVSSVLAASGLCVFHTFSSDFVCLLSVFMIGNNTASGSKWYIYRMYYTQKEFGMNRINWIGRFLFLWPEKFLSSYMLPKLWAGTHTHTHKLIRRVNEIHRTHTHEHERDGRERS